MPTEPTRRKVYHAIILDEEGRSVTASRTVFAENAEEARSLLEGLHGAGRVVEVFMSLEPPRKKVYDALIVDEEKVRIIERPTVLAETSTEAKQLLEERYGTGRVLSVWNEEDSHKER